MEAHFPTKALATVLGEYRTLWDEHEQAMHCDIELLCVAKALLVKYQNTAHRLCMVYS